MKFIKQVFLFIFFSSILFSCDNKQEEAIVNLSDITPTSNKYKEGEKKDTLEKEISYVSTLPFTYKNIIDSLKLNYEIVQQLDTILFLDRFEVKSSHKFYWKNVNDSIVFLDWEFKDSVKTATAFYNWLDCFGKNCKTIKVGEKVNFQKRNMLFFVNENHLIMIDADKKIDQEKWIKLLKDQNFGNNWKYIISQPRKGKAIWSNLKNDLLSEIKI